MQQFAHAASIALRCMIAALVIGSGSARADDADGLSQESDSNRWWRNIDFTVPGAFADWRVYTKDGLRIDRGDIALKFNLSLFLDSGDLQANSALDDAFPTYAGQNTALTRARITLRGWLRDHGDFKLQGEYSERLQIKDMWWRFKPLPYIGRLRIGNMKEPFSIDQQTAGSNLTFLSRALPTIAFAPGRNMGLATTHVVLDQRMTWSLGAFWNTASFDSFAGAKDSLSNSIGGNLTGRVTYLPRYEQDGRRLVHLGLSLSAQSYSAETQLRAVPETALTDTDLVDTGKFRPDHALLVNPEFALVAGPWSAQAEYFFNDYRLAGAERARPWGIYGFVSYLLTGESRRYDRAAGVFDGVHPAHKFDWGSGGWGAWEVALRLSHIDLNSGALEGGRQTGLTGGLNWYLNDHARLMLNAGVEWVSAREYAPSVDGGRSTILQGRLQIDL